MGPPNPRTNPGNQYLDLAWYHLWLCFWKCIGDKSANLKPNYEKKQRWSILQVTSSNDVSNFGSLKLIPHFRRNKSTLPKTNSKAPKNGGLHRNLWDSRGLCSEAMLVSGRVRIFSWASLALPLWRCTTCTFPSCPCRFLIFRVWTKVSLGWSRQMRDTVDYVQTKQTTPRPPQKKKRRKTVWKKCAEKNSANLFQPPLENFLFLYV